MTVITDREFTLEELVARANRQLDQAGQTAPDGRVAERLDARTVRYYSTLGLVPKPHRYQGRQARYNQDHLLYLLAIKALQAQGLTLSQIQGWLAGKSEKDLRALVGEDRVAIPAIADASALQLHRATPAPSPVPELRAFRLAPGVELLIDPSMIDNPDQLASRLQASLDIPGDDTR